MPDREVEVLPAKAELFPAAKARVEARAQLSATRSAPIAFRSRVSSSAVRNRTRALFSFAEELRLHRIRLSEPIGNRHVEDAPKETHLAIDSGRTARDRAASSLSEGQSVEARRQAASPCSAPRLPSRSREACGPETPPSRALHGAPIPNSSGASARCASGSRRSTLATRTSRRRMRSGKNRRSAISVLRFR